MIPIKVRQIAWPFLLPRHLAASNLEKTIVSNYNNLASRRRLPSAILNRNFSLATIPSMSWAPSLGARKDTAAS
jgi:hypothetical protein